MSKRKAITPGSRFGMLVVLSDAEPCPNSNRSRVRVICDCGQLATKICRDLTRGNSNSCGCLRSAKAKLHRTHGKSKDTEYIIWLQMRARCQNLKHPAFKHYGGRGIRVCEAWEKFESFYADMGDRPSKNLTLDRIDNNGNYEPGNCRWATWSQQNRNKRNMPTSQVFL